MDSSTNKNFSITCDQILKIDLERFLPISHPNQSFSVTKISTKSFNSKNRVTSEL